MDNHIKILKYNDKKFKIDHIEYYNSDTSHTNISGINDKYKPYIYGSFKTSTYISNYWMSCLKSVIHCSTIGGIYMNKNVFISCMKKIENTNNVLCGFQATHSNFISIK